MLYRLLPNFLSANLSTDRNFSMAVAEIALEDDNHYFVKTIKYFIGGANIKTLTSKQKPKLVRIKVVGNFPPR